MTRGLVVFRELEKNAVFSGVSALITKYENKAQGAFSTENLDVYLSCVSEMINGAEELGAPGNVWQTALATALASCENVFSLSRERRDVSGGTLEKLAERDFETLFEYARFDFKAFDRSFGLDISRDIMNYRPTRAQNAPNAVASLAAETACAKSAKELFCAVKKFYRENGAGRFAVYGGYRWDGRARELVPAAPLEAIRLRDIIGYEEQKRQVVENTEAFLAGRPANNVLLYGAGGTGKSSTVKALLNEYSPRGLRMIELYKHQINDLEDVLGAIKNRNYKFILFMDDLSFEQFEVEYKFLKAFIEGGLEKRPDNVLIYATSNRRHLMKETWNDREDKADDMHESETMQEKMSLVDRFGVLIRYFSPERDEYMNIVKELAAQYGVEEPEEELERGAVRWELRHGGFSGRSARQFVEYLGGKKKSKDEAKKQ